MASHKNDYKGRDLLCIRRCRIGTHGICMSTSHKSIARHAVKTELSLRRTCLLHYPRHHFGPNLTTCTQPAQHRATPTAEAVTSAESVAQPCRYHGKPRGGS